MNDNIAAIATSSGIASIAIIKISGETSISEINKIFNKDLLNINSHKLVHGNIIINEKIFDEVLISVMKNPNSYTGEDVVEINTHGGNYVVNELLKYLITHLDIRLAQNGEFSKRAFLNNKKSLTEIQVANDIINAKTSLSHELALNNLNDSTIKLIEQLRNNILDIITLIEVNIDYPEYEDIEQFTTKKLGDQINDLISKINVIVKDSNKGQIIKNGIRTAIIGVPNVGKSTLLNTLSKKDIAIVTNIKGTTRDKIESEIIIKNVVLNLIDTAGIRNTNDEVEKIGVQKSLEEIKEAQLILFVVDNSKELTDYEKELYENIKDKNHIVIKNKSDLESSNYSSNFVNEISVSAKEVININELEDEIIKILDISTFDATKANILSKLDDISKLEKSLIILDNISLMCKDNQMIDLIELELKEVLFLLSEILNIDGKSNLIDEMFSRFCLGK